MKQILDRVTITGADDSIDPKELKRIQEEFPFVEWGILVSSAKTLAGRWPRFPSTRWMKTLDVRVAQRISVHLCGRWVRRVCKADLMWMPDNYDVGMLLAYASRVQLNFHGYIHEIDDRAALAKELRICLPGKQIICQLDGANDDIVSNLYDDGVNVAGLYDHSGGAGRLPDLWPLALKGIYTGYAGGLSPENVAVQLERISELVVGPVWIDVETHVRSDDDRQFDLVKVRAFLKAAEPWVLK